MTTQLSCKARVRPHLTSRLSDIRRMWRAEQWDENDRRRQRVEADHGRFNEYGLSFDYVEPGTFHGQRRGYFRYQISWGGPSDEFRFVCDERLRLTRVEYWFMDWFDGAKVTMRKGRRFDLLAEIFDDFKDMGIVQSEYDKATA